MNVRRVTDSSRLERDASVDDELSAVFTPDGQSLVYQQRVGLTEDPPHPDAVDSLPIVAAGGQAGPSPPMGRHALVHRFAENDDWLVDLTAGTAVKTDFSSATGFSWQRKAP